jgi:hypothetical protein
MQTQSSIADVGVSVIQHGRMYLAVVWNFRAVLGLLVILGSIAYWYRMGSSSSNDESAMSSVWFPVITAMIGAFITFDGGIDYLGEVFTFSSGADALILHDGRANLTENASYTFKEGTKTE